MAAVEVEPSEVKWQVALWALMPLALGAMTQTTGRVFEYSGSMAFWIRASPFVCIGDMVCFGISLVWDYIAQPTLSLRHIKAELAWRFRDEDFAATSVVIAGRSILTRWMLMILGGIPFQTVKLLAMRGVPYTKTWALMYFLPQIFGELLTISALILFSPEGITDVQSQAIPSKSNLKWLRLSRWFCHCVQAFAFHFVLAEFASWLFCYGFNEPWPESYTCDSASLHGAIGSMILVISFLLVHEQRDAATNPAFYVAIIGFCLTLQGTFILQNRVMWGYLGVLVPDGSAGLIAFAILSFCLLYFIILTFFIYLFGRISILLYVYIPRGLETAGDKLASSRFGQIIGVPRYLEERDVLIINIFNLVVLVLGYCYLFDGKGTVNPSWTGVFGKRNI